MPSEEIVSAVGEVGTIYFVNTNGLHKGGLVKEGIRRLAQGNYLKREAFIMSKAKKLLTYDYEPKINILDRNGEAFNSLTDRQKLLLT